MTVIPGQNPLAPQISGQKELLRGKNRNHAQYSNVLKAKYFQEEDQNRKKELLEQYIKQVRMERNMAKFKASQASKNSIFSVPGFWDNIISAIK